MTRCFSILALSLLLFAPRPAIRVPFTSVGFQYGLNRGRWYGPGNGNQYSTTP